MNVNQASYAYGAAKSAIREIAGYGAARRAQVGAENVFDFSIGNPSVPAPDAVCASIVRALELPPTQLHSYTPAPGLPFVREAVAASLTRRFAAECGDAPVAAAGDLYLTCGASASISITLQALLEPGEGDEVIVIAPYFPEYRVFTETSGGVSFADGSLRITGDGSVTLTDGEDTVVVEVTGSTPAPSTGSPVPAATSVTVSAYSLPGSRFS